MRRGIPLVSLTDVLARPEQIVDDSIEPLVVVTVYRTSKIEKYWREDEDLL